MIGTTIGNYVVKDKIGEGGMGVVYVAEHPRIGRKVAIKVLLPEYSQNQDVVSRFFTEARASSAIKNEHIIDIIDFGELPDKSSYIIMEWLEGEPLTATLERDKHLPLERALHVSRGIARALAAAHRNGIVHRDLKPDNIFLVTRGEDRDFAKVLDFGIAKLIGNEGAGDPSTASKTRTGAIIGTPMYMSPEQCRGVKVDERSDIYSFGVIVYQMLTGQVPFAAEGLGELLLKHMTEAPRPLRELIPTLPENVERAVLRSLEKDPAQRFRRIEDFVAELGAQISTTAAEMPAASRVPTAVHVSATDTIGAAAGETVMGAAPPAKRSGLVYVAVPLVLLGAGGAFLLSRGTKPPEAAPAAAIKPEVEAPRTVTPPPAAPPKPAQARLAVRATPPEAEILIDGRIVSNPYAEEVALDGKVYDVEIRALGYVTHHEKVSLDKAPEPVAVTLAAEPTPQKGQASGSVAKGAGKHHGVRLPAAPPGESDAPRAEATPHTAPSKADTKPAEKPSERAEKHEPKPADTSGPTIYKGTRGKLMTDDPFATK